MAPRSAPSRRDVDRLGQASEIQITIDGVSYAGRAGQTIAGILLTSGEVSWRRTSTAGAPRGLFCGIGVCFDCIVTVNGLRDVRACQRRAADGDVVDTQHDALPKLSAETEGFNG